MSENLPNGTPPPEPAPPAAPTAPAYGAAPIQPKGLAIAALIVGIVSLVFCWPFFGVIGIAGGIVAVILGIIALRKAQSKGMSLTGIITGAVAIVGGIIWLILSIAVIGVASEIANDPDLQQQLEQQLDELDQ